MKREEGDNVSLVKRTIPRRTRRGLIEAAWLSSGNVLPFPPFPGELAGASLKRGPLEHLAALVEPFPGELAGASLKHEGLDRRTLGTRHPFPGELAGASLKPPQKCDRGRSHTTHSPANSPGPH